MQDRGAIIGRVTDPSNAVIAGATITVTNQDTGIKITSVTNDAGNYAVRGMAFGIYEIACEAKGFRKYLRKGNSLDIAQIAHHRHHSRNRLGGPDRRGLRRRAAD